MVENSQKESLENTLKQFYGQPLPRKDFMAKLEQKLFAEGQHPVEPVHHQPVKFLYRPVYIVFMVIIAITISVFLIGPVQVQAAIGKLFQYIPGFGIVEQEGTIRSLSSPVSMTRNGVTLTIEQVIASSDKTGIVFTLKGLSPQTMADESIEAQKKACWASPLIRLPDGTEISPEESGAAGFATNQAFQKTVYYPPISKNIDQVFFVLPCIQGTSKGKAPENWELSLNLEQAKPEDVELLKNFMVSTPVGKKTPQFESDFQLSLDQVIEVDTGYIFVGNIHTSLANYRIEEDSKSYVPLIADVSGNSLPYTISADLLQKNDEPGIFHWAYLVQTKDIHWPLTIQFPSVGITCLGDPVQIPVDTAAHLMVGEMWSINQTYSIGDCKFKVNSLKMNYDGYSMRVSEVSQPLRSLNLEIEGYPEVEIAIRDYANEQEYRLIYEKGLPRGKIRFIIPRVTIEFRGPWSITWQPATMKGDPSGR